MKKLRINYPWAQLEKGQGFFVPCLDTEQVIALGLRDALSLRIKANAIPGIRNGFMGVWFSRLA